MRIPEPYRLSDSAIARLGQIILKKTERVRKRLTILQFDEVNVMRETDVLYSAIEKDCRKIFRQLYIDRYTELWRYLKHEAPDEDIINELVDMYLAGLWDEPNENTHYSFGTELIRKRDRAKEAIIAVPTKTQKQLELQKAARYVIQQSAWYCDFVSQDAEIQAYKDAGVKKVQRHEMNDDRVCDVCKKADGDIYPIDDIPPLPHLRCRRWFTPV